MRLWDLTSGTAKMELAMHTLRVTSGELSRLWSDDANRKFQETYLDPLEPKVRNLLDSIHRLSEALDNAQRQCGTQRG
jgi:hypothetical protein